MIIKYTYYADDLASSYIIDCDKKHAWSWNCRHNKYESVILSNIYYDPNTWSAEARLWHSRIISETELFMELLK